MSVGVSGVLDASALLAFLQREPGRELVAQAFVARAAMSVVNWAEVLSKAADAGTDPDDVAARIEAAGILGVGLVIVDMDDQQARGVARLRPITRQFGLSLGDRACLNLAKTLNVPAYTTDRSWTSVESIVAVSVRVIR